MCWKYARKVSGPYVAHHETLGHAWSRTQKRGVMAAGVIASSLMTGDLTPHQARGVGQESWVVPSLTLACAQAVAALRVAEVVPTPPGSGGDPADEVGPTARRSGGGPGAAPTRHRGIVGPREKGVA